ncbi:hypothetical protein Daesc_002205 [Daldinia eschscholtzii]|uniref:Uncharacterized protein n=1 Tax=Daldinia eschscholtzii TaxID=292717 RepID=A0AAX6MWW5_9PEZI
MAEAIATPSLICNVMQVISFTGEVFNLCRNTSKDGSPTSNLAFNTAHLSALVATLQERLGDYNNVKDESEGLERQAKARLKNLTSDLIKDTTELQKLLGKGTITNFAGKTHIQVALQLRYFLVGKENKQHTSHFGFRTPKQNMGCAKWVNVPRTEIHQMDKLFESFPSEERGMILFFCCKDLRDVAIRIQNRPIYLENADEQGPFKVEVSPKGLLEGLLKIHERQMTCIKWLLVHGSDAHMVIDEEDVELGRSPTRHTRLIRPTAFQAFHLNLLLLSYDILHSYPALSDDIPLSPHGKKTFRSHLQAYANVFNGHGIDEEDINLFCRIPRQSRLYRVVYSINTICFREAVNMVAASIEEFTILKYASLSSSIIKLFSTYGHIVDTRLESGKWLSTEEILRLNPMELLNLAVQELFT